MQFVVTAAFVFFMASTVSFAQDQPTDLLSSYFSAVRSGNSQAIPAAVLQPDQAKAVLAALPAYQADTVSAVRAAVYTLLQRVGSGAKQLAIRQASVGLLTQGGRDADDGNAGLVLDYLTTFKKEDFISASKDTIRVLFGQRSFHFEKLLRLIGFLELSDQNESIRPYTQIGNPQATRWAAIVSLARMSDVSATEEMMRRARKLPVNDDVIYKIFPDLAYSRRQEAIAYMVEALNSDDKNCLSADAEKEEAIPCGYRIMEQLAPVIDGYPLELDKSGDIKTKDYVAALKTVREWFVKHPDYKILRDRY
ncbi:hypothetical protein [Parachryseolinea silvisoli]|uniref:hypothetical protein n=1 Tax=Parachryseolinea silvisoli TaxID=2873601 RepID=UPI002265A299|nr:hypothetical protein [Parachryseolinea silvisoli]MCD9017602.1 hypothetical protein [Parachryseolinea silvisoli]